MISIKLSLASVLARSLQDHEILAIQALKCYTQHMDDTQKTKAKNLDEWPNTVRTRDELDSDLEDGLNSGVSERSTEDIFEAAIARVKNGKL